MTPPPTHTPCWLAAVGMWVGSVQWAERFLIFQEKQDDALVASSELPATRPPSRQGLPKTKPDNLSATVLTLTNAYVWDQN